MTTDPNITRVLPRRPEPSVSTAAIRIEKVLTKVRDFHDALNDLLPAGLGIIFVILLALAFRPR